MRLRPRYFHDFSPLKRAKTPPVDSPVDNGARIYSRFSFPYLLPRRGRNRARVYRTARERRTIVGVRRRILRIRVRDRVVGGTLIRRMCRERILVNDSAYASPASLFLVVHAFSLPHRSHTPHAGSARPESRATTHTRARRLPPPEDAPRAISFIAPERDPCAVLGGVHTRRPVNESPILLARRRVFYQASRRNQ